MYTTGAASYAGPCRETDPPRREDALGAASGADRHLELRLPRPAPAPRRSPRAQQGAPVQPDGVQGALLAENPALADYYRDSPEAALDLLRLIREATKKE